MGREPSRHERLRALVGITCVAAVALVVLARLVPTTADLIDGVRERGPSGPSHATAGGRNANVRVGFVEWVRRRVGPDMRYALEPQTARETPAVEQWLTFRLSPAQPVDDPARADVVVWYGGTPSRDVLSRFGRVERYARGFGIGYAERTP